ncbi:MFS transporter [Desulfopila aestuarii]|uniref:Sugar transporter n=1 Tax=Desulfopila aestuarii DSM 18488 TaxID=1121416 RepID=A0A1M7Y3D0_9BACT|nr:MFS transporter [Desulfopila aestuarii]SHO46432.1 Sugar transporter [Desulfopila aestuarii DSM 18488]
MSSIITNCWALLLGMGLIMLGNGLQGTLLGVRASLENFSTTVIGLVMSGYFLGLIFGCNMVSKMVARVGHIRTFAALASLASTSILVQAVFVDPLVWWAMRFITGFSYAGVYVVAESWLNEAAENNARGKLLSFYMLISLGGLAGGQLLLNLSSPSGFDLFVLTSLLISLAVIPILLSVTRAPQYEAMENVSISQLFRVAPLGVFGMLLNGMMYGAIFSMGAVYATEAGMSVKDVSFFMGAFVLGGFIFQYPLGWMSDAFGRRRVIICCCVFGAGISFFAMDHATTGLPLLALVATIGGLTTPLYALCSVHTNDFLTPSQMVAASGTLVLLSATGAALGSPLTAMAMDVFGPQSFYGSLGVMLSVVAVFALYVYVRRASAKPAERSEFVIMTASPLTATLNPNIELEEIELAHEESIEDIHASIEKLADTLAEDRQEAQ